MAKSLNNPLAFPACNEASVNGTAGMTLRDWFAGQALSHLISGYLTGTIHKAGDRVKGTMPDVALMMAGDAYIIADAMLAARSASVEEDT